MTDWTRINEGFPNGVGSEGGRVCLDEEHPLGARVTLEEGGATAPWSITCGIDGWMCHTVFCSSEAEGRAIVTQVKASLEAILKMIPQQDGGDASADAQRVVEAIEKFVTAF